MLSNYSLQTEKNDAVNITAQVKEAVARSGVETGLCTVFVPHTTAALTITSFWDPNGLADIQDELNRVIPTRIDFKHQHDTPQDAAGHVKSTFIGATMTLIIAGSALFLGHSQGIYFLEFDGPRSREFFVKIVAG